MAREAAKWRERERIQHLGHHTCGIWDGVELSHIACAPTLGQTVFDHSASDPNPLERE